MSRVAASCLSVILKFAIVFNRLAYSLLDWIFTSTDTFFQVYLSKIDNEACTNIKDRKYEGKFVLKLKSKELKENSAQSSDFQLHKQRNDAHRNSKVHAVEKTDRSRTLMSVERSETSVTDVSDTVPDACVHDLCRASNVNLPNEFTSDNSKGATSSLYGISNRIHDDSSKQSTALNKTISREQVKGKEGSTTVKAQLADANLSEKCDMENFGPFGTALSSEGLVLSPALQVNEKEGSAALKTQLADICTSEKYDIGSFGPFGTARSAEGQVPCAVSGRICVTRVQSKDRLVKPTARSPETAVKSSSLQNM